MADSRTIYDPARVEAAVSQFHAAELTQAEALLASARLARESLKTFREQARAFRAEHGEAAVADFARNELNDLICDMQDEIAPTIRTYNSLLRDLGQGAEGPAE